MVWQLDFTSFFLGASFGSFCCLLFVLWSKRVARQLKEELKEYWEKTKESKPADVLGQD